MTIKNEREILFYKTMIDTVDRLVVYGNLERSKEEALSIAGKYTKDVFEAADKSYTEYLKADGE